MKSAIGNKHILPNKNQFVSPNITPSWSVKITNAADQTGITNKTQQTMKSSTRITKSKVSSFLRYDFSLLGVKENRA